MRLRTPWSWPKSIRARISLGFAAICILFVVLVGIVRVLVSDIDQRVQTIAAVRAPSASALMRLDGRIHESLETLRAWMLTGNPRFRHERAAVWAEISGLIADLDRLSQRWDAPLQTEWRQCRAMLESLRDLQAHIDSIARTPGDQPTLTRFIAQSEPLAQQLHRAAGRLFELENQLPAAPRRTQRRNAIAQLQSSLARSSAALHAFLLTGDASHRLRFDELWADNARIFAALEAEPATMPSEQRRLHQAYGAAWTQLDQLADELIPARTSDTWHLSHHLLATELMPLVERLLATMAGPQGPDGVRRGGLVTIEELLLIDAEAAASAQLALLLQTSWLLLVVSLLAAAGIAVVSSRAILHPVNQLVATMAAVARGDLTVTISDRNQGD